MRVGIAVYSLSAGGVSAVVLDLASALSQRGHEVHVFTTRSKGPWFGTRDDCRFHHVAGMLSWWRPPLLFAKRMGRFLRQEKFDVLITNFTPEVHLALPVQPPAPTVVTVIHNDYAPIYRAGAANLECVDWVVAVSPKVAEGFCAYTQVDTSRVVTIANGVPVVPQAMTPQRREACDGMLRLLYVGRLVHAQKGVLLLPDILAGVRAKGVEAGLTIVGDGEDRHKMLAGFRERGLDRWVEYHRYMDREAVRTLYGEKQIFVLPSYYEGFPVVLMEAMAAGCVPVVSKLSGITDFAVRDRQNGRLVATSNVQEFVAAIVELRDAELRESMASRASDDVRKHFSVDAMVDGYERLFGRKSVAGRRHLTVREMLEYSVPHLWWSMANRLQVRTMQLLLWGASRRPRHVATLAE